jgi:hypothetical protein
MKTTIQKLKEEIEKEYKEAFESNLEFIETQLSESEDNCVCVEYNCNYDYLKVEKEIVARQSYNYYQDLSHIFKEFNIITQQECDELEDDELEELVVERLKEIDKSFNIYDFLNDLDNYYSDIDLYLDELNKRDDECEYYKSGHQFELYICRELKISGDLVVYWSNGLYKSDVHHHSVKFYYDDENDVYYRNDIYYSAVEGFNCLSLQNHYSYSSYDEVLDFCNKYADDDNLEIYDDEIASIVYDEEE